MNDRASTVDRLEAARARGAAAADPVAFGIAESLLRRALLQQGEARDVMVQRVDALLARLDGSARSASSESLSPPRGALAELSSLVDRLGRMPSSLASPRAEPAPVSTLRDAAPQPLKSVVAFKGTWSRLRVEDRLRQALAQVPAGAGPLNTSNLVNRALETMRDLSPAYLDAFMTHVDTLQWLEQSSGAGELSARAAPAEGRRKTSAAGRTKG